MGREIVSDMSKILIWKQFTTNNGNLFRQWNCFWYVKDTNLKAIHNQQRVYLPKWEIVSDMSKILIWKQFTTVAIV